MAGRTVSPRLSEVVQISRRIRVLSDRAFLTVEIRFPHSLIWLTSRILVMMLATAVGFGMLVSPFSAFASATFGERCIVIVFTIVVFAIGAAILLDTVLRLLGRETILVKDGILTLSTELFGLRRAKSFLISEAAQLRLVERQFRDQRRTRIVRKIAFDYHGRQIASRGNLSRREGEGIYRILAPYFHDRSPLGPRTTDEPDHEVPE
jgi:hypothetical protein